MQRWHPWPVGAVLGGALLAGLFGSATAGRTVSMVVLDATGFALAAVVVVSVRVYRPRRPAPWLLVGLGILCSAIGDVLWDVSAHVPAVSGWATIASAIAYLSSYPLYVFAALLLLGGRAVRREAFVLLEAAVFALAAWLALWVLFVRPDLAGAGLSVWDWVPTLMYPPLDLLVIVAVWRLGHGDLRRSPPWLLLLAGFLLMFACDSLYAMLAMPDGNLTATVLNLGWLMSYACLAAAAAHPAMRFVRADPEAVEAGMRRARVATTALACTVPFVLMLLATGETDAAGRIVPWSGVIIVVLAFVRFHLAASRNRRAAETLAFRATHDALTGLANRTALRDRLALATLRAARSHRSCAVVFIDLDDFKLVNDSLGHDEGDRLIVEVAQRLRNAVRAEECVARLGGDEFVVVLEDLTGVEDAIDAAERVSADLSAPYSLAGLEVVVGASIGVAPRAERYLDDVDAALRDADLAMYSAKGRAKGGLCVFDADMHARAHDVLAERNAIRQALARGELSVEYQPIYSSRDGIQRGVEALARWTRDGRRIPPDDFIPLAEASGEIVAIGEWVLATAAQRLAATEGADDLLMSVNLSSRQLQEPGFAERALEIVRNAGVTPNRLVLELTESALLEPDPTVDANLRRLGGAGFQLAIDDFGTGYSSLAYLKRLAVDWIKIDRMFIQDLGVSESDEALVRTLVRMGTELGIRVIAEGVETPAQLDMLRALGCDAVQGFLLARPGPAVVVAADPAGVDRVA